MRYVTVLAVFSLAAVLSAQNPPAEPRFEVVSIKPHTGPFPPVSPSPPAILRRPYVTVEALVLYAFDVDNYQLIDVPAWASADHFDVDAKAEGATAADMRAMTRSLLRDRFGLQAHQETRNGTTYSLVLANGRLGSNLKRNTDDCRSKAGPPSELPAGAATTWGCSGVDEIARSVSRMLSAPVVDNTGLDGKLEYLLSFSPEGSSLEAVTGRTDTTAPHLATALQEQLGLKLERGHGPFQVLVIDHIERPSEN